MRRWKGIILSALAAVLLGSTVQLQALAVPGTGQNFIMNTQTVPTEGDTSETKETGDTSGTTGTVTTPQTTGVAQVTAGGNTVSYETITEAWRAAANSKTATIKLLKNVSTGTEGQEGTCSLSGGNITLDMNGYQWTYVNGEGASGSKDMIEVSGSKASLTVKGGEMRYEDGGNGYAGACLYATNGAKLTVESGNFASNVGPVVYTEDAKVTIKGGKYANTASTGSKTAGAVSVHGGTLNVSGGEMGNGGLAIDNQGDDLEVALSGGTFSKIVSTSGSKATADSLTMGDILADGYGYRRSGASSTARSRSSSSDGAWMMDTATLSAKSISNAAVRSAPVASMTLTSNTSEREFMYAYTSAVDFTAEVNLTAGDIEKEDGKEPLLTFTWDTYKGNTKVNGTDKKDEKNLSTSASPYKSEYSFPVGLDVGEYTVRVKIEFTGMTISGDYTREESIPIKVIPRSGTMTNTSAFPTTYKYGETAILNQLKDGSIGAEYFSVSFTDASFSWNSPKWTYRWYDGDTPIGTPSDAGQYTLIVTVTDSSGNYGATQPFTITINPIDVEPFIMNKVTKIYDGTTKVTEDVQIGLREISSGTELSGVKATAGSATYDTAEVGTNKRITATNIVVDSKNYKLNRSVAVDEQAGTIVEAKLIMKISHSPMTQKINRPVTITVTLLNRDDESSMDGNWIKPDDIILNVSGTNSFEEEHRVNLKAVSGSYGVYTCEYTTSIPGDKSITARLKENANYSISNSASDNTLTVIEKGDSAMKLTTDRTMLTYGESATYTAEISSVDPDDKDSMAGTVQFYQGFVTDENRVGEPQNIPAAGGKASITLDKSRLTAGEQWIYAVYSGNQNFGEARGEVASTVAKKQLTWNSSDLTAYKTAGTYGEAGVYGSLTVDGIIDEGVTLTVSNTMVTSGFADTIIAGTYNVQAIPRVGIWNFTPQYLPNYDLPQGNPQVAAKVTSVTELVNPPKDKDGLEYKMVMEEGISSVPGELKGTSFGTPDEIRQELVRILTKKNGYTEKNIEVYDVVLQVSEDKGETWYEADVNSYPTKNLTVTIPYPSGTKSDGYDFIAAHMFASTDFNKVPGMIEQPKVKETSNGLVIKVTGLSPIGIAWKTSANNASSNSSSSSNNSSRSSSNSSSSRNTSGTSQSGGTSGGQSETAQAGGTGGTSLISSIGALTWDNNPILLYACLAAGTGLVLIITGSILIVRKRKR